MPDFFPTDDEEKIKDDSEDKETEVRIFKNNFLNLFSTSRAHVAPYRDLDNPFSPPLDHFLLIGRPILEMLSSIVPL